MKIIQTIVELQTVLTSKKNAGKSIGFVPTMGALHQGHISLVKKMIAENDVSVVSIFVNPTQFNDPNDLLQYPRTLEADCALLQQAGNPIVFAPSVEEIYPEPDTRQFGFGRLETVMEGQFRPGHFNGVAQVVSRLFDIVQPDRAYFGEKDFQQVAIIRALVKQLHLPVTIIACPIIREADGLALSSRNARLTAGQRKSAVAISRTLFESREKKARLPVAALKQEVINQINAVPELHVEYFDLVDHETLQSVNHWSDATQVVGCIAVYDGEVRLIDNLGY
ncbi:MAG: Pantothenate synthetase [Candidatus Ordinivivax streblomastigis]|uniref:Pantothenate synthetase n=1 Tax=Candidatus Ordinivivax streblomastigis TaxID=2540710 RepID=A0A5M8P222_9BACT|nr:MAG: Pantothenate synthetase [Candidatus Ordinivivax streblomastigis]